MPTATVQMQPEHQVVRIKLESLRSHLRNTMDDEGSETSGQIDEDEVDRAALGVSDEIEWMLIEEGPQA